VLKKDRLCVPSNDKHYMSVQPDVIGQRWNLTVLPEAVIPRLINGNVFNF
jgi:hypothetical protein